MGRKSLLLAGIIAFAVVSSSFAGVPNPALSDVPNVIISPGGFMDYTVTVISSEGPVDTANVEVQFSATAQGLICWCVGETPPSFFATTDSNGEAVFNISGGGCIDSSDVALGGNPVAEVFANGVLLGSPGVVGPDIVDNSGNFTTAPWNPAGTCEVGLTDAVFVTPYIINNTYHFCADLNSDGNISVADATLITPGIINAWSCTAQ